MKVKKVLNEFNKEKYILLDEKIY